MGHNGAHVVRDQDLEDPAEDRHAASHPSMTASNVWEIVNHTNMCRENTAVKISACTTRRRRVPIGRHAHPGEVDLALHPGLSVNDGHRAAAAPILGALSAVAMQGAQRHRHPWRASRSPILTTVKPFLTHLLIRSWLAHKGSHADPYPCGRSGRTRHPGRSTHR